VLVVFGDVFDGVAADGEVGRWLIGVGELDEHPTELAGLPSWEWFMSAIARRKASVEAA
jgi:hypothetical protein